MGFIYAIGQEDGRGPVKIGCSEDPQDRLKNIQTNYPLKLVLLASSDYIINSYTVEANLHKKFMEQRLQGEWFDITQEEAIQAIKEVLDLIETENLDLFRLPEHGTWLISSPEDLGRSVSDLRRANGLTQDQASKLVSIERSHLCKIENGKFGNRILTHILRMVRRYNADLYIVYKDEGN